MEIQINPKAPLTLAVTCKGVVVQTYRFVMLKPNGEHVEVTGSNPQATVADSHFHVFAPPIAAGTVIRGVLSYTTTNGAQPYSDEAKLQQNGVDVPNSVDATNETTSASGVAARFVEYVLQ